MNKTIVIPGQAPGLDFWFARTLNLAFAGGFGIAGSRSFRGLVPGQIATAAYSTNGGKGDACEGSGPANPMESADEAAGASSSTPASYHQPVLLKQTLEALAPSEGRVILDGTLGGGGHSEALLEAGATVIGLDQDRDALNHAATRLARFGDRFRAVPGNFRNFPGVLDQLGIEKVDGILLDVGVSSWQLDQPDRGFSFQHEGPLDMRMNREGEEPSAKDLLNSASQEELARIFFEYGEESASRKVAAAVVREREVKPLETTSDFVRIVESVIPRRGKKNPATKVFQAVRIAVNDELGALRDALESSAARLNPGGRLAVITFHSLEDRIVKQFLRRCSDKEIDRPEWPAPRPNPDYQFNLIRRKPITASSEEEAGNPRSRSAKLRVAEKR